MFSCSSKDSNVDASSDYTGGERLYDDFSHRSMLRNDRLRWDDFSPLLGQSGWEQTEARREWDQIDTNGDGSLDRSNFLKFASSKTARPYITKMEQNLGGQQQLQQSATSTTQHQQGYAQQGYAQQGYAQQGAAAYSQQDSRVIEQGQQTLQLAEEKLHIDKHTEQAGQAQVSKHIETKQVHTNVPLVHEEFFIERRPVSDGRPGNIEQDAATIRVPLMREELVVQKQANVVEEVVIGKRPVQEQQTVNAELMRERLDVHNTAQHIQNQQTGFQQQSSGFQQQSMAQAGYTGPQGTQNLQQGGKLKHGSHNDIVG